MNRREKNRYRRVVVLVVAALTWVSEARGQAGEIRGRVRDAEGHGVAGATVTIAATGREAQTDSAGVFLLRAVPPGRQELEIRHVGYGTRRTGVEVAGDDVTEVEITVSAVAIRLTPLHVNGLSTEERRIRGSGFRRAIVTREQLALAENTNLKLPEALRLAVPTVLVRRRDRVLGSPVCVELRTQRDLNRGQCHSPAVYLDGVPVSNPTSLYDNLDLAIVESIEVIPSNEAGVKYGASALYGAILISTRRPGIEVEAEARRAMAVRRPNFDWKQDEAGHPTSRVLLFSTAGHVAGALAGLSAARECLGLRSPSYDGLVSDCGVAASLGTGAAAVVLPALGSGLGAALGGRTERSKGSPMASGVAAAMVIVPAYALVLSGSRNDSPGMKTAGYTTLLLGPPLISTAADYLFRSLR